MPASEGQPDLYSSWVGLIYVFNLIVGTGALTLPAAFSKAGWLLSLILLILLALVSFITVTFVIECIACANATIQWRRIQHHKIDGESEALMDSESEQDETNEQTAIIQTSRRSRYYTLNEKVELGQMAELFFNKWGRLCFYISLCIYLYGDLAIYAAAIGKSLSDIACPSNSTSQDFDVDCFSGSSLRKIDVYRIFVALFALLVGPFTYFNVQKTKYLQMATTTMRWCAFLIMVTLACIRLGNKDVIKGNPEMFEFNGVPALIGASVYSFMCHHSLPGLVAPFSEKQYVVRQIGLDYLLICGFYLLLALTGAFAFKDLNDLYTLNFLPSSGDYSGFFMETILYFLSLFPVFTLSTSFPIIAITLQNNLKALFLDVNTIDRYGFILRRLTFPTITVLPPILIAFGTHNLHSLVKFTGAYGGACIQYFIPAFLILTARKCCATELGRGSYNKYRSVFRGSFWIYFVILWATACVVLVTVNFTS